MDTTRNRGFITPAEQTQLDQAVVAVAGAGGDGGQAAITLARMGVRSFRIADPEDFAPENLNRQAGCNAKTIGRNKAEVIAEEIRLINPEAEVVVYPQGVTPENVDNFVAGATLVVDEMEYTRPDLAVMLARAARAENITVLMAYNVGFGALITAYRPNGMTLERAWGLKELPDGSFPQEVELSRQIVRLPKYGDINVLAAVRAGKISAPSVAPGVELAAGMLATEVFCELTGRRRAISAPHVRWFDALEGKGGIVRRPKITFIFSALRMAVRCRLGLNRRMAL